MFKFCPFLLLWLSLSAVAAETPPTAVTSAAGNAATAPAAAPAPIPTPTPIPNPEPEMSWQRRFILGNISISRWFDSVADGLDRYLVEKQMTARSNESSVELENITNWTEGSNVSNSSSVRVNLRLPNVEEYWHLKFTTYDEIDEQRTVRRGILRQGPRENNYGATLGLFKRLGNVRTAFQPRLQFAGSLKIAHSLTFESVAETEHYQVNPKLEFYATPNKGAGSSQAINVHFPLSKIYSLTLINQADYQDRLHLYTTNNGLSVGQSLTEKTGLGYGLIFDGSNQPNYHLVNYSVSVTFSELLFIKILDYQVAAFYNFTEPDFKPVPGVTLSINVIF